MVMDQLAPTYWMGVVRKLMVRGRVVGQSRPNEPEQESLHWSDEGRA